MSEEWVFTFGASHLHAGHCVRIKGDYETAREKMVEKFGLEWAFQYPAEKWDAWKSDPSRAWTMETEISIEDC